MSIRSRKNAIAIAGVVAALGCAPAALGAGSLHDSGSDLQVIAPQVISDLPCFEGTDYVLTGTVLSSWRSSVQNANGTFHYDLTEVFDSKLVPVNGDGTTWVEHGTERTSFNSSETNTVFNLTVPMHDTFVGYDSDGNRIAGNGIRVQGVTRLMQEDKDGVPPASRTKVDFTREKLSCPTG
jgi:hypothetical protein